MKILSYDIESVSGSHNDGSMCAFGYCLADENFEISMQEDVVMRPRTKRYEPRIKLHYEKSYIKAQPKFPQFYEKIKSLFSDADYVIGFSVLNDVEFLNSACVSYGLKKIEYEFLDVQLLYKVVYKKATMSGLEKIANELGIEYLAHRSDEDARVTLLTLKHLCEKEGVSVKELLRKYCVTLGVNNLDETTPCFDGTYTKREKNYLILDFIEKNYEHNSRFRGGFTRKTFAFSDEIKYKNVDEYRRVIKKVFQLNGKISVIESSNVFVYDEKITDKEKNSIEVRNAEKTRVKLMPYAEFLAQVGELPVIDFSSDYDVVRNRRAQIKKKRDVKRDKTQNK